MLPEEGGIGNTIVRTTFERVRQRTRLGKDRLSWLRLISNGNLCNWWLDIRL
jgi:hypothetical protein